MLFAILALTIFMTTLFYRYYIIEDVWIFDADVTVSDKIGIQADNDAFHFGKIIAGNWGRRNVDIRHDSDHTLKVQVVPSGDIGDWIYVKPNDFFLEKNTDSIFFQKW